MSDSQLSDGVVTLSPLCLDDLDAHLAGEDDQLVWWLNGGPSTRAGTEAYIRKCMQQWSDDGPLRAFGIHVDTQAALVGTIDLRFGLEDLADGQVNIAYGLYPKWRGRGLATRAVHLVCQYAATQGVTQGVIRVEPENAASVAVAQRAGFRYVTQIQAPDGTQLSCYVRDLAARSFNTRI
ncbi:GNAT family N-acetyltransferase [Nonomuraea guangzhouensis]|uniref:GNAT family N-acetyltransferase n=1 Tax=Nonomuraea guangzhouensis TaxID=1291555 RepID=A0ABW4GNB4_9ACTN|nr:GNAT family N-acetyltransferase [Nonomuraea guangzhouensis]